MYKTSKLAVKGLRAVNLSLAKSREEEEGLKLSELKRIECCETGSFVRCSEKMTFSHSLAKIRYIKGSANRTKMHSMQP